MRKINELIRKVMIAIIIAGAVFVMLGVTFNLVFRTISYSFYKNAVPFDKTDEYVKKFTIGDKQKLTGYERNNNKDSPKKAVIFFGGSSDIAYNAALKYGPLFENYTFFCIDYPGIQDSDGQMNLKSMNESATKLYDYVSELDYVDDDNIYVIGYSFGTGIATYLASERMCKKLVVIGAYPDVTELYNQIIPIFHSPLGWFVTDNIDAKEYAKSVDEEVLIVVSNDDKSINSKVQKSMANYFSNKQIAEFEGVDHEKYFDNEAVVDRILDFIK